MDAFNAKEFVQKSLEVKLQNLQQIHFCVLNCIYENAKTQGCITERNTLSNVISQCFCPSDMLKAINISGFSGAYLFMCLKDLEERGLICIVRDNPWQELAFALTELGLQAVILKVK